MWRSGFRRPRRLAGWLVGVLLLLVSGGSLGLTGVGEGRRHQMVEATRRISSPGEARAHTRSDAGESHPLWRRLNHRAAGGPADEGNDKARARSEADGFALDVEGLLQRLAAAPQESASPVKASAVILEVPGPDGTLTRFRVVESPIFEPDLARRFPSIKTYLGQGVDDPTRTMRCDVTPQGFHAVVLGDPAGAFAVLPVSPGAPHYAITTLDAAGVVRGFPCEALPTAAHLRLPPLPGKARMEALVVGSQLRRYRIAIAATAEFTNSPNLGGGTVAGGLAAITTWLNGANAVYERELAVRFILVANNTNVIYTDPATDPYPSPNESIGLMIGVRNDLPARIGVDNYDIGHVLGVGIGGRAFIGVVCSNSSEGGGGPGAIKGGGVTMVSATAPAGNLFDLGVFCHELGHQCGADHAFNGTTRDGCQRNRNPATAWEVGSGSSIMSYPGICDADNVVTNFDLRFHTGSFGQIVSYLSTGGAVCGSLLPTGNVPPNVSAGSALTIPRSTPFQLTAAGSDADGDALTYTWEQFDAAGMFVNPPYGDQPTDPPTTTRPLFRNFPPTSSPVRLFPSLPFILNHANVPPPIMNGLQTAENLPGVTRVMRFRVTARDNRAGGGGISYAETVVNVHGPAGPFRVNNLTGTWAAGSQQVVTWDVAGTDQPPISCSEVSLALSYDGGNTFTTVAARRPNTGTATIVAPPEAPATTQARLRVAAANGAGITDGNTFFDITDANFTITNASGCAYTLTPTGATITGSGASGTVAVTTGAGCMWSATSNVPWIAVTGGAGGSGPGVVAYQVASNPGPARTGTMTIAGQSFTVQQARNDRATTVGMFRPTNGFFYLRYSNTPGFADTDFFYGLASDIPVIGDWNGDGVETVGIFRQGQFFLRNSNTPGFADVPVVVIAGTQPGDLPLAGDWDGDGIATVGLFRQGVFLLRNSLTSGVPDMVISYGGAGDIPIVGDWDGDGRDTIGVFRAGQFFLRNTNAPGLPDIAATFGAAGDTPLAGDWDGDGRDTPGVFRATAQSAQFFLSSANASGPLPVPINYGLVSDRPVVGKWR